MSDTIAEVLRTYDSKASTAAGAALAPISAALELLPTGSDMQCADRADVNDIVSRIRDKGYGLRSVVHEVVESRPFLHK